VILGVCNPPLVHRALSNVPEVGIMLPCNVAIEKRESDVLFSIVNQEAMMTMGDLGNNAALREVAVDVRTKSERVADILNPYENHYLNCNSESPRGFSGKALQFYSRACPPDSSRGDSKEKGQSRVDASICWARRSIPPAASSGVPWFFPMEVYKEDIRKSSDPHLRTSLMRSFYSC